MLLRCWRPVDCTNIYIDWLATVLFAIWSCHRVCSSCCSLHQLSSVGFWGADPDKVAAFWRALFATEQGNKLRQVHPVLRQKTWEQLRYTIPALLHEDAGPFAKPKSANRISWPALLGTGKDFVRNLYSIRFAIPHPAIKHKCKLFFLRLQDANKVAFTGQ